MKLYNGDCLEVMKKLPDNSVDSIVADPPYGLKFMGKKWDYEIPSVEIWQEAIRVLKPGGHLLSFGGSRTYHRMAVNIEDAGFEIRDQIMYVYGSGFPKSRRYKLSPKFCQCDAVEHNVGSTNPLPKQDDHNNKVLAESDDDHFLQDVQRSRSVDVSSLGDYQRDYDSSDEQPQVVLSPVPEILPLQEGVQEHNHSSSHDDGLASESLYNPSQVRHNDHLSSQDYSRHSEVYGVQPDKFSDHKLPDHNLSKDDHKPDNLENVSYQNISRAFPLCQMCRKPNADGWGTALKPAHEPICMARKPLSEKTIAENVLKWGTGGINIGKCRVEATSEKDLKDIRSERPSKTSNANEYSLNHGGLEGMDRSNRQHVTGRFPANFIHDGSDEVVGLFPETKTHSMGNKPTAKSTGMFGVGIVSDNMWRKNDSGSAARFFYCAKASKKDRNEGLEGFDEKFMNGMDKMGGEQCGMLTGSGNPRVGVNANNHPTVKPTALMQYLVRLVTPVGGTVLDPFMGSGSTGKACVLEGFDFIGIELDPEYFKIAKARIEYEVGKP